MKGEMTCSEKNCENTGCAHFGKHKENAHCEGFCRRHPGAKCHMEREKP